MDRYNELIRTANAANPNVTVVEFADAVDAHPGGAFERGMRPDGSHIDLTQAPELVTFIDQALRQADARLNRRRRPDVVGTARRCSPPAAGSSSTSWCGPAGSASTLRTSTTAGS